MVLVVAFLCICAYLLLEGVITKVLVSNRVANFTFKDALRVPLVEQLFNGITPFSSGGQPGQLIVMLQTGIDGGRASSVLLMKFVVYQAMIVINFFISLVIGFHFVASKLHFLALFVLFGFLIHFFCDRWVINDYVLAWIYEKGDKVAFPPCKVVCEGRKI